MIEKRPEFYSVKITGKITRKFGAKSWRRLKILGSQHQKSRIYSAFFTCSTKHYKVRLFCLLKFLTKLEIRIRVLVGCPTSCLCMIFPANFRPSKADLFEPIKKITNPVRSNWYLKLRCFTRFFFTANYPLVRKVTVDRGPSCVITGKIMVWYWSYGTLTQIFCTLFWTLFLD